jgi:hypothetical protein
MGGVSADGAMLWLSGRYNAEVYAIAPTPASRAHESPSAKDPTDCPYGPNPAATHSATPGSCADDP